MNKFVAVAILGMIMVCANAHPSRATPFQDTRTVLAEMDKDAFGSTFISAIALNLATSSPLEEITLLIEEIVSEITTEQEGADAKNRTDQAVCDESIANFNQQINEQRNTIASLEKAITDNTEILQQAKIDLEQANRDYDETVEAITTGTAQREAEHSKWAEEDYQNSISIATLEEGVKLINHMIHGVAFAQIKTRYEKVMDKLKENDGKHSTLFKPLITSLTQLATKLNYENVMKILELLNNIRKGIVEEQEASKQAEERSQRDWEVLLNHLENQKRALQDKRARLNALIENTEALLKQLTESLENHRVELENLQETLAAQIVWCDEQSNSYLSQSSERERELAILNKLLEHLNEKFSQVNDYISNRSEGSF